MKYFRKISIIIIIFSFSSVPFYRAESAIPVRNKTRTASAISNGVNDIFFKANRFYDDGNFKNAAKLYNQLISQGVVSGNIYYNLGNAYYKMGKTGKALLNYERAKKFIPDNEGLFANISFIKSTLNVKQPQETYSLYQKVWRSIRSAVSINTWFVISVILFFSACMVLGIGFLSYRFRGKSHVISGILIFSFIISLTLFIDSYNSNKHFKEGIIIASKADVRYSPSYSGVVAFELVEGMKAQIIRKQDTWTYIRLNKGKSGWVESEAIEAVW